VSTILTQQFSEILGAYPIVQVKCDKFRRAFHTLEDFAEWKNLRLFVSLGGNSNIHQQSRIAQLQELPRVCEQLRANQWHAKCTRDAPSPKPF